MSVLICFIQRQSANARSLKFKAHIKIIVITIFQVRPTIPSCTELYLSPKVAAGSFWELILKVLIGVWYCRKMILSPSNHLYLAQIKKNKSKNDYITLFGPEEMTTRLQEEL